MTHLYFEDAEVGTTCKAGPYLVPKEEIILFAKQYDPVPRHIDEGAAARSIFGGLMQCPYLLHLHFVDDPASASAPCPRRHGLG